MTKTMKQHTLVLLAALLLTACSDSLLSDLIGNTSDGQEGIPFAVSTIEIGDESIGIGTTRGAESAVPMAFAMSPLEGDNPSGLKVYRQPLPLVGIHPRAVNATTTGASTRAAANEVVAISGINFHDSLTIWGYTSNDTELFDQILLTKVRNWRNSVEWPYGQGNYMKFYAVAPSLETVNMSSTSADYSTPPMLTYTLSEKAEELFDVLYGESEHISIASGPAGSTTTNPQQENLGKDNKFVNLEFRHITSAIRFSQGVIPSNITIKTISLQGIYSKAVYNPAANDTPTGTEGTWSTHEGSRNYTIESKTISETENVYIDGGKVLFMLPQTLPASATLQVTVVDTKNTVDINDDKEHTISCSLSGDLWKKGYTINYMITVGELEEGYYLTADAVSDIEHSDMAVSGSLNIHSYHLYSDYSTGGKIDAYRPVTWDVVAYSTDYKNANGDIQANPTWSETRPTWLTDFHGILTADNHYEGGDNATASFTVAAQQLAKSAMHSVVLYDNTRTDPAVWDLSKQNPDGTYKNTDKSRSETANCYIVNRTGPYTFPLVYGNMSADNPSMPACFKDHQGNTIKKYQIREQIGAKLDTDNTDAGHSTTEYLWSTTGVSGKNIEPTLRVVLLWQDKEDLITSPSLTASANNNEGTIGFTIGKSEPGNAVFALQARKVTYADDWTKLNETSANTYGDWETLWTWHIWMTDEVYKNAGREDEQYYDTYYLNGPTTNVSADHIPTITNYSSTSTQILPVNLGWVPDDDDFGLYEPRNVWVKIRQSQPTENKKETIIQITQHARQQLYTGTGTVYQWGRPTAFPAVHTIDGLVRHVYDIEGNDITSSFVLAQAKSSGDGISQPYSILQLESNQNTWFDFSSLDYATPMWNSTNKTVYDPCPPGFCVPEVSIFTGFSRTGASLTSSGADLNMWQETTDANGTIQKSGERSKGGYFYCDPHTDTGEISDADRYKAMVYMPATGEWHGNKTVGTKLNEYSEQLNQINGIYWTSDYKQDGTAKACMLWITPERGFSSGSAEKPAIGFFATTDKQNYYSSVRGIRPRKN